MATRSTHLQIFTSSIIHVDKEGFFRILVEFDDIEAGPFPEITRRILPLKGATLKAKTRRHNTIYFLTKPPSRLSDGQAMYEPIIGRFG